MLDDAVRADELELVRVFVDDGAVLGVRRAAVVVPGAVGLRRTRGAAVDAAGEVGRRAFEKIELEVVGGGRRQLGGGQAVEAELGHHPLAVVEVGEAELPAAHVDAARDAELDELVVDRLHTAVRRGGAVVEVELVDPGAAGTDGVEDGVGREELGVAVAARIDVLVDRIVPRRLFPVGIRLERLVVRPAAAVVVVDGELVLHHAALLRRRDERLLGSADGAEDEVGRVADRDELDAADGLGLVAPLRVAPLVASIIGEADGKATVGVDVVRQLPQQHLGLHAPALADDRLLGGREDVGHLDRVEEVVAERARVEEADRGLHLLADGDLVDDDALVFRVGRLGRGIGNGELDGKVVFVAGLPGKGLHHLAVDRVLLKQHPGAVDGTGGAIEPDLAALGLGGGGGGSAGAAVEARAEVDGANAVLASVLNLEGGREDGGVFGLGALGVVFVDVVDRVVERAHKAAPVLAGEGGVGQVHPVLGVARIADGTHVPAAPGTIGKPRLVGDGHAADGKLAVVDIGGKIGPVVRLDDHVGWHQDAEDAAKRTRQVAAVMDADVVGYRADAADDQLAVIAGLFFGGVLADGNPVAGAFLKGVVEGADVVGDVVGGDLHPDLGVGVSAGIGEGDLAQAADHRRAHAHRLGQLAAARLEEELLLMKGCIGADDALGVDEVVVGPADFLVVRGFPAILGDGGDHEFDVVVAGSDAGIPFAGDVQGERDGGKPIAADGFATTLLPVAAAGGLELEDDILRKIGGHTQTAVRLVVVRRRIKIGMVPLQMTLERPPEINAFDKIGPFGNRIGLGDAQLRVGGSVKVL